MGIISWILVGLLAGLLAKLIMRGDDPGGIIVTVLIGVAGAFVGGLVVGLLGGSGVTGLNVWSILVATLGAIILLAVYRLLAGRRASWGLPPGMLLGGRVRGKGAWRTKER